MTERAERLHASHWQGVVYLTGGGSPLLSDLLSIPGASNTVLEAAVPYAAKALSDLLGTTPEQAASNQTGRALSMRAYQRARDLGATEAFGIGLSASLSSSVQKKGQTRAHWAIQTAEKSSSFELLLDNANPRSAQELQLNEAIWATIELCLLSTEQQHHASKFAMREYSAPASWQPLLAAAPYATCTQQHDGRLLLPGSFNPAHDGHREMLATAEAITGLSGAFEMTLRNADKPDLDYLTAHERLEGLAERPVWVTNLSNFEQKSKQFPNATFVLGTDTLSRIAEPRFYADDPVRMLDAFNNLAAQGARFLVFGRRLQQQFVELTDLNLPTELAGLCQAVPAEQFRNDISSSAIRAKQTTDH